MRSAAGSSPYFLCTFASHCASLVPFDVCHTGKRGAYLDPNSANGTTATFHSDVGRAREVSDVGCDSARFAQFAIREYSSASRVEASGWRRFGRTEVHVRRRPGVLLGESVRRDRRVAHGAAKAVIRLRHQDATGVDKRSRERSARRLGRFERSDCLMQTPAGVALLRGGCLREVLTHDVERAWRTAGQNVRVYG